MDTEYKRLDLSEYKWTRFDMQDMFKERLFSFSQKFLCWFGIHSWIVFVNMTLVGLYRKNLEKFSIKEFQREFCPFANCKHCEDNISYKDFEEQMSYQELAVFHWKTDGLLEQVKKFYLSPLR